MAGQRRYDVDTLRVMVLFFLVFYHGAIAFQSFGWSIYFISNKETIEGLWIIMAALNTWRIPILFLIAGIALRLSFETRSKRRIIKERAKTLLIPLVFGIFTTAYLVVLIPSLYLRKNFWYFPIFKGAHLWFLYNIFLYSLICIPLLTLLSNSKRPSVLLTRILGIRGGTLLFAPPIVLEGWLLKSRPYEAYAETLHGLVLGLCWFVMGIILTSQGEAFWRSNRKNLPIHGTLAFFLYLIRLSNDLEAPNLLIAFESFNFVFAVLGLGACCFNKTSKVLDYLKEAVFPVYIVHLPIQQFIMFHLVDRKFSPMLKYLILLILTLFLSFAFSDIIRRIYILRPFFGLKISTHSIVNEETK